MLNGFAGFFGGYWDYVNTANGNIPGSYTECYSYLLFS